MKNSSAQNKRNSKPAVERSGNVVPLRPGKYQLTPDDVDKLDRTARALKYLLFLIQSCEEEDIKDLYELMAPHVRAVVELNEAIETRDGEGGDV